MMSRMMRRPRACASSHEVDEILARAEARIDLEEVLDAVAVEGVEPRPLLEDRADPERRDAEALQVVEPAADARRCVPPCQRAPDAAHSRQSMSGRAGVVRSACAPRLRQQLAACPRGRR